MLRCRIAGWVQCDVVVVSCGVMQCVVVWWEEVVFEILGGGCDGRENAVKDICRLRITVVEFQGKAFKSHIGIHNYSRLQTHTLRSRARRRNAG